MYFKQTLLIIVVLSLNLKANWSLWRDNINHFTEQTNNTLLFTEDTKTGLIVDNLIADVAIASWGFKNWSWGTRSFHFKREDWFEKDSKTGGSDKTGHFYMTYLLSRVLSSRLQDRGMSLEEASFWGSCSALLSMTLLEVGDGTSAYGFSKEDLLADSLGAFSAYLIRSNPKLDEFLDIRLEYFPTSGYLKNRDTATDYSGMKHLIAFEFSGFDEVKSNPNLTPLKYTELQLGFYSRGYRGYDKNVKKSQQLYFGVGFNLKEVAKKTGIHALENLFEFYQPGGTYIESKIWKREP
jgi:hypothetical protein